MTEPLDPPPPNFAAFAAHREGGHNDHPHDDCPLCMAILDVVVEAVAASIMARVQSTAREFQRKGWLTISTVDGEERYSITPEGRPHILRYVAEGRTVITNSTCNCPACSAGIGPPINDPHD